MKNFDITKSLSNFPVSLCISFESHQKNELINSSILSFFIILASNLKSKKIFFFINGNLTKIVIWLLNIVVCKCYFRRFSKFRLNTLFSRQSSIKLLLSLISFSFLNIIEKYYKLLLVNFRDI